MPSAINYILVAITIKSWCTWLAATKGSRPWKLLRIIRKPSSWDSCPLLRVNNLWSHYHWEPPLANHRWDRRELYIPLPIPFPKKRDLLTCWECKRKINVGLSIYCRLRVKKNFLTINLVQLKTPKLSKWALLDKKTLDCRLTSRLSIIMITSIDTMLSSIYFSRNFVCIHLLNLMTVSIYYYISILLMRKSTQS